jgi:hypothetical protein
MKTGDRYEIGLMESSIDGIEFSDNDISSSKPKRAIITLKIINKGANSKNLEWVPETMKKVAAKFRGVPFRYDLNGQNEGSHTRDKLSSPFYDVGWTYSDERGAYYDPVLESIVVKGEVTHPEVIDKLSRMTSDGKREINFGSMGAMMTSDQTKCNICGATPFGTCSHERGKTYHNLTCNMVPTDIQKALHVALTNDPADKNAVIQDAIFQDMTDTVQSTTVTETQESPNAPAINVPMSNNKEDIYEIVTQILKLLKSKQETQDDSIQEENLMANSLSKEDLEKKKKKTEDDKNENQTNVSELKEQDLKDIPKAKEENKEVTKTDSPNLDMLSKDSAESDLKPEAKEVSDEDKEKAKKKDQMANNIAGGKVTPILAMQDSKKDKKEDEDEDDDEEDEEEEEQVEKGKKVEKEHSETIKDIKKKKLSVDEASEKIAEDHVDEDEKYYDKLKKMESKKKMETADDFLNEVFGSDSEFKIKSQTDRTQKVVVTQDNSNNVYAEKYKNKLIAELADSYVKYGKAKTKTEAMYSLTNKSIEQLEIYQDAFDGLKIENVIKPSTQNNVQPVNNIFADAVPEFGGTNMHSDNVVELHDMTPEERKTNFGHYGKWDVIFNPQNANKYRK